MQYRSIPFTASGPQKRLSDYINEATSAMDITKLPTAGQVLKIKSSIINDPASRVMIGDTSFIIPYFELAPNEEAAFIDYSGRNGVSTMDKFIKVRDAGGAAISGDISVSIEIA